MILAAASWMTGAALALNPGEPLSLVLAGDVSIQGTFRTTDGDQLTLVVDGQPLEIALALVESATRDGLALPVADLRSEAQAWASAGLATNWTPRPLLAGTASAILPGSGHLLLQDWKTWAGYAVVDGVLLGLAGWFAFREEAPRAAATFLALDGVFRAYAVGEAVRDSRRIRPVSNSATQRPRKHCYTVFALTPRHQGGVVFAAGYQCSGTPRP